jgi:hypothetical protein
MCAVMTVLLWIRILLRCWRIGGRFGLDDLFITIAWMFAMAWGTLIVIGNLDCTRQYLLDHQTLTHSVAAYKYGINRHIWDVPPNLWAGGAEVCPRLIEQTGPSRANREYQISWFIEVLFFWGTCFNKMSILLFYRRLVVGTYSNKFKWMLWCAIGFVVAYTITWFTLICGTCFPLNAQWKSLDPTYTKSYHCAPVALQKKISLAGGILSVVSDLYSVVLPAMLLLRITVITKRQKIGLLFIFGMGFL